MTGTGDPITMRPLHVTGRQRKIIKGEESFPLKPSLLNHCNRGYYDQIQQIQLTQSNTNKVELKITNYF